MYLDSFFSLVEKCRFFPHWYNVLGRSSVVYSRTFSLARLVFIGETYCLLDFGGPFYIKLGVFDLKRYLLVFGGSPWEYVGRRVVLYDAWSSDSSSSMLFGRLLYSKQYSFFCSYVVSLKSTSLSFLPFLIPVFALKWFRYRKRFWFGFAGVKVCTTENGLRE